MIIKVPIYVEIDGISHNELLEDLVKVFGNKFTKILRKENLENSFTKTELKIIQSVVKGEITIKTKEQALEYLRTKK